MLELRYFANNAFQKGHEVKVTVMALNQEQERADLKIPGKKIGTMYKSKPTSNRNLELFIENLEKDLINLKNVKKFRHNITREEQVSKEIRNQDEQSIRIQDKGSRFIILGNSDYEEKVRHQINRS